MDPGLTAALGDKAGLLGTGLTGDFSGAGVGAILGAGPAGARASVRGVGLGPWVADGPEFGPGLDAEFGDNVGLLSDVLGTFPGAGGGGIGGGGGLCSGGEGLEGAGQLKQGGLGGGGELSFPGVSVTRVPGILSSAEHVCSHIIQCHLRIELMF